MPNNKVRSASLLTVATVISVGLTGCYETVQTSSGRAYLDAYGPAAAGGALGPASDVDREVREVALVEPQLRFPARIGLARVYRGDLSAIPAVEAAAWGGAAARLDAGDGLGEFVPLSTLVADLVYGERPVFESRRDPRERRTHELVRKIRLGAARQHVDAVLIYEVFSETDTKKLATSVANLTVLGAFIIPSEQAKSVGYAHALLIDVRNGYPYGTAAGTASAERVQAWVGAGDRRREAAAQVRSVAVVDLVPEVEQMMAGLRVNLAARDG